LWHRDVYFSSSLTRPQSSFITRPLFQAAFHPQSSFITRPLFQAAFIPQSSFITHPISTMVATRRSEKRLAEFRAKIALLDHQESELIAEHKKRALAFDLQREKLALTLRKLVEDYAASHGEDIAKYIKTPERVEGI